MSARLTWTASNLVAEGCQIKKQKLSTSVAATNTDDDGTSAQIAICCAVPMDVRKCL